MRITTLEDHKDGFLRGQALHEEIRFNAEMFYASRIGALEIWKESNYFRALDNGKLAPVRRQPLGLVLLIELEFCG